MQRYTLHRCGRSSCAHRSSTGFKDKRVWQGCNLLMLWYHRKRISKIDPAYSSVEFFLSIRLSDTRFGASRCWRSGPHFPLCRIFTARRNLPRTQTKHNHRVNKESTPWLTMQQSERKLHFNKDHQWFLWKEDCGYLFRLHWNTTTVWSLFRWNHKLSVDTNLVFERMEQYIGPSWCR